MSVSAHAGLRWSRLGRMLFRHGKLRRVCWHDDTLGVQIKRRRKGVSQTIEIADGARRLAYSRDHPERIGETTPAFSLVMALADYDETGDLCYLEVLGLPPTIDEAKKAYEAAGPVAADPAMPEVAPNRRTPSSSESDPTP